MFKKLFSRIAPAPAAPVPAPGIAPAVDLQFADDGIRYRLPGVDAERWLAEPFAQPGAAQLGARLGQLFLDNCGELHGSHFLLPWKNVYALLADPVHADAAPRLGIPPLSGHRPELVSRGSLGDADFVVAIERWVDGAGLPLRQSPQLAGAVAEIDGSKRLLAQPVWALLQQLRQFHATPAAERSPAANERAWGQLRRWAVASHAPMSDYLDKTVVLTPDKLRLDLNARRVGDDKVIEVVPGFDNAPPGWLEQFDRMPTQDVYNVPAGNSMTKVVLDAPVRRVLEEIKRMPGRRVVGARAEAFMRNPGAVLGPAAAEALDQAQIEEQLTQSGLALQRFAPLLQRDAQGGIAGVLLRVESLLGDASSVEELPFADAAELGRFCDRLAARIDAGHQCCGWQGNDLEIVAETADQLRELRAWAAEWRAAPAWSAAELFDLSHYSDRIAEIGVEQPYAVPVVARKAVELDWFAHNVMYRITLRSPAGGQTGFVSFEPDDIDAAARAVAAARAAGASEVQLPGAPFPIPLDAAQRAVDSLARARREVDDARFEPEPPEPDPQARTRLIVKPNIDQVEHAEQRSTLLAVGPDAVPELPAALRPEIEIKPHQRHGIAWLQQLWRHSPQACRGALLADDMGLGKTLQLLSFMAWCIEREPGLDPVLVVAPLALLENWRAEIDKFFQPGALPLLTLYGATLRELRVPQRELDAELADQQVGKLLRKGWIGNARVVLTTYETLRDLEFTLALQPWSIMVCDEAQKIKNPGAMVTRTAKKQKVRFRVACTGTPVENSLADLWCLFDFIQPGLLGALSHFSRSYRQPIEASTEEQQARVRELRDLIEPQTLRRTKQEVASKILPRKLVDDACRALPMSQRQLTMYWAALETLKRQKDSDPAAQLQTLHSIRRICSDPYWQEPDSALRMPLAQLLDDSPKLRWLVELLEQLRQRSVDGPGEKVIVFCEFLDLQTLLQRVLRERFQLDAHVVNGATSASLDVENSRQKLIDRFQRATGFNVIILSPLAVGFGVNIQQANHVVHFTRTWNPAKEDQATDRAYRIGQQRDVTVYYPSVTGTGFKSFDEVLHGLLEWKRGIAQNMLNASGDLSIRDFGELALEPLPG
ncbi:DEAD/DEAH box helicase [Derxia lacustris]|uniref:DEAD/DEAH box helicase n=1 Tax=Derxia lacustris TaxID=764842 RepID=UPI000A16FC05|nr:DEAD/DEAH box helicase [Derxia lacustris]